MTAIWRSGAANLRWKCLFVLPPWLKVWWQHFGDDRQLQLYAIHHADTLLGIAPLVIEGATARLAGDPSVCDYLDVIATAPQPNDFFNGLLEHLRQEGITTLELGPLRADAAALSGLAGVARKMHCEVDCQQVATSAELALPSTWEAYLQGLKGKQRHEIRRKFRRLHETGRTSLRCIQSPQDLKPAMPLFLKLFRANRPDKATFMSPRMASFFTDMAEALAAIGMLKLYILDLDETPAAAVMCFDVAGTLYLYNNGYDQHFHTLSVGLLSKVLTIKDAVQRGTKIYDFLKGDENYKRQLGGQPVPIYNCVIHL